MKWVVVLVLLQTLLLQTKAIYEDQAGSIDWLKENIGPVIHADFGRNEKTNLYVGTEENVVASLSIKNGNIVWRHVLQSEESIWCVKSTPKGVFTFSTRNSNQESIGYARSWTASGTISWESAIKLESNPTYSFCSIVDKLLTIQTSSDLIQVASDGNVVSKKSTPGFMSSQLQKVYTVSDSHIAILEETEKKLSLLSLSNLEQVKQIALQIDSDLVDTKISHVHGMIYRITWSGGCVIVNADISNPIIWISTNTCAASSDSSSDSNIIVFDDKNVIVLSESGSVISKSESTISASFIKKAFVNTYKKDSSTKHAILVTLIDGSLQLIKEEKVVWTREEALGQVTQSEFVELPIESIFLKSDPDFDDYYSKEHNLVESYIHRLKGHLNLIGSIVSNPKSLLGSFTFSQDKNSGDEFRGDELGIKKMMILLTKPGKIYAMATSNGNIKWSKYLNGITPITTISLRSPTSRPGLSVLIGKKNGNTVFLYFDPFSGEFEEKVLEIPGDMTHITKLSSTGSHHTHYLLVIDSAFKAHVLPESASNVLGGKDLSFFVYDTNEIKGYKVIESKNGLSVEISWTISFPKEETIESVSQIPHNEKIASIGRILGNRKVLYKYVNPNMFAVATLTSGSSYDTLTIYVIDSITGQVLVQRHHYHAKKPVHLVIRENWLVYHFWNDKDWSHQFVVHELFESVQPDVRIESNNFTSYDFFLPEVLSQSYVLPAGVTSLSVSQTRRGITSKLILVGLATDQLYGLPKRLLDPRRPYGAPNAETQEEGLVPYDVVLPINHKAVISYKLTISKIRSIHTFPAMLESTSLVLAYGLDIFSTRVTPSQTFDSLTDEFQYETLILTIIGLGAAWVVTAQLAKRAQTNQKWL